MRAAMVPKERLTFNREVLELVVLLQHGRFLLLLGLLRGLGRVLRHGGGVVCWSGVSECDGGTDVCRVSDGKRARDDSR